MCVLRSSGKQASSVDTSSVRSSVVDLLLGSAGQQTVNERERESERRKQESREQEPQNIYTSCFSPKTLLKFP